MFESYASAVALQALELEMKTELKSVAERDAGLLTLVKRLQTQCHEQRLYLAALTQTMIAKGYVKEAELKDIAYAIDRLDGTECGSYSGPIV